MPEAGNAALFYILAGCCIGLCVTNVLLAVFVFASARSSRKAMDGTLKELFGVMKKIEGLTSGRRAQILREFDKILDGLSARLPTVVAARANDSVFETESGILKRLAEIDPAIKNEENKDKLDELIRSMEQLQEAVVSSVSETVRKALDDARREINADEPPAT